MIPHRWNALLRVEGRTVRYGGVHALPPCDRSRQYDDPALAALIAGLADKEFGSGNWSFVDKRDPYKFNATPASDYGL